MMATPAPPVKKACDACHRRKVRCSGGNPCKNCGQASLNCTYLAVPQKKGPKGSRAKIITEIRDTQQHRERHVPTHRHHSHHEQHQIPPPSLPPQPMTAPITSSHDHERNPFDFSTPPLSPGHHARDLNLLSMSTVDSCVRFFFEHHYPTMPIFDRSRLNNLVLQYRTGSPEVYCLVLSLCAFIMVQPGMSFEGMPMPASYEEDPVAARYRHANALLKEVMRIRKAVDYVESATVYSVQISFFIFCCYFGLDKSNQCWYHLREASTLAHILNMDQEVTYQNGDPIDMMFNRRFYWLLLVTERAHAMERHRPLSMLATIELPTVNANSADAAVMPGFLYLATLFRLMDEEFMALWNKAKSECSTAYISQLQAHLSDALPSKLECTENQAADVKVTQHWLRCMVWNLSLTNGVLSSTSDDIALHYKYPLKIVEDLMRDIRHINQSAMEVHGVGLIEKFFDMACTLSDVITYVIPDKAAESDFNNSSPQQYLNQLLNLISRLRGGASRYVPLLMAKLAETLPNAANPLSHMPTNLDAYADSPLARSSTISDESHVQPSRVPAAVPPFQRLGITQPHQPHRMQTHTPLPDIRPSTSFHEHDARPILTPPMPPPSSHHPGHISLPPPPPSNQALMFESYSPSVTNRSDVTTPPIAGILNHSPNMTASMYHQNVPRSIPQATHASSHEVRRDEWNGYHG